MVEIGNVKEVIKDYIIKQLVSMGESSPAIRLLIPLAKRAITNNINSFDKFLKPIADKDGIKEVVEQMYHVKDNKKYIGEKYDMNKAHEICERYKEVLPNDVDLAMFMLQLMLNIMIMLNYLKNGLVVI